MLPVVPTLVSVTQHCLAQAALCGWREMKTLHLGLLPLSSPLCGGFSIGGGPGELWGLLGHPEMSLFTSTRITLLSCPLHLSSVKLVGFKHFSCPMMCPGDSFQVSLSLVGILVPLSLMS